MTKKIINVLMADDDEDDCFFFARALKKISLPSKLKTVNNGEELLTCLIKEKKNIPDMGAVIKEKEM